MRSWLRAVWLPLFLVVVPPGLFMVLVAGPRPTLALATSLAMPLWFGACAAFAGWRVVERGAGGPRGVMLAGVVTASANVLVLCGLIALWCATPWGSTDNVGVVKFIQVLPGLMAFVVGLGTLSGWLGGRAAARRARRCAARA
ncbi:MAG TPA: hypothetical protein VFD43_02835 [Planctomycetota bacterium]|nr:hypothetical protein [Planctomycetota bacterium]